MRKIIYSILSLLCVANSAMADDTVTGAFVGPSTDNKWTLDVNLTNESSYTAFQMDIQLPAGLTVLSATPVASRLSQSATATVDGNTVQSPFIVTCNLIKERDNTVRVTAYNIGNYAITGESGSTVLKMLLQADDVMTDSAMTAKFANVDFVEATNMKDNTLEAANATTGHLAEYLKISALEDGTTKINQTGTVSATLQYGTATDGWNDYEYGTDISLTKDNSVWFRAKGSQGKNSTLNGSGNYLTFVSDGKIAASQNIMSLLDTACTQTEVPAYAFYRLFNGCTGLKSIPDMSNLTLATDADYAFNSMFSGCTGLIINTLGLGSEWKITAESTGANNFTDMFTGTGGNFTSVPEKDVTYYVLDKPYTRTMTNQWGTICLPFAVTITGSEDYDFYKLSSVSNTTLELVKIMPEEGETSTILAAGTPVIIRRSGDITEVSIPASTQDESFVATPILGSLADGLTLTGTFTTADITSQNGYIIANNAFWNIQTIKDSNKVYCSPFRAYLAGTLSNGAKQLSIGFAEDSDVDGIDAINAIIAGTVQYYDLNGRRIPDLQKGVNIIKYNNGVTKKVIIK